MAHTRVHNTKILEVSREGSECIYRHSENKIFTGTERSWIQMLFGEPQRRISFPLRHAAILEALTSPAQNVRSCKSGKNVEC